MKPELWPVLETAGALEPAEAEWLHTNGAGAYSMSTVALMHTRRFHGVLVAALEPPLERHVIVSHAETVVAVGPRSYSLATHQFPDIAPTPGYRLLTHFGQDPLPRWVYKLGKGELHRTLALVRGKNAVIVRYMWTGKNPVKLTVKPLLSMRPIHELRSENTGVVQRVSMRQRHVVVQPVSQLPELVFGYQGVFMGSPDWWRRFEFSADRKRNAHYQEDLWTPGTFEVVLQPRVPGYLSASLSERLEAPEAELMEEAASALTRADPGENHSIPVRVLSVAAEQFRVPNCERPSTLAGYPWLGVRTRDALVSLPGLYLATGHIAEAKDVLSGVVSNLRDNLVPSGLHEASSPEERGSLDASLWLFEVTRQLVASDHDNDGFAERVLFPALCRIFERICAPGRDRVWLSVQGFLVQQAELPQTWMDSIVAGRPVTPRNGVAIELQALWARACETLAILSERRGDRALAARATARRLELHSAFIGHFWCKKTNYPYDCISLEPARQLDAAVRPNALIALDIDPSLFEHWQAEAVVDRVQKTLLTPYGIRTLEPAHPDYIGYYDGGMDQRRAAYHQGVAWTFLLGAYARAALRLSPDDFELQMDLKEMLVRAADNGQMIGQIAQVSSGDPPHVFGGCPAQAWNVAELLRTLRLDLGL